MINAARTEREFDLELEERARDIRQGKAKGEPIEQVIAELREKFSQVLHNPAP